MTMSSDSGQDFLVTGLPRSGTTLTCHLLNKIPDSVALHEPMVPSILNHHSASELAREIQQFFAAQRNQILTKGTARSKSWNGMVPSNPRGDGDQGGSRKRIINGTEISVTNVVSRNFSLYIKHPAFFTAALSILSQEFKCFAIVRNPLSVLLSWRVADMAVTAGRMPAAEKFSPSLAASLNEESNVLERQFILLDFCFAQYACFLHGRTVKYEDIIYSRGRALSLLNPAAKQLNEPLESRNTQGVKSDFDAREIADKLLKRDSPCWSFYGRPDVEALFG